MTQPERFDSLILGNGNGGMYLAWHLGRSGRRTAMVERRWIGGSCRNINCLPTKNEIWSARAIDFARHGANYGAKTGPVTVDMAKVRQRKREMVEEIVDLTVREYEATGVDLVRGTGHFTAPKTLEVQLNDGGTRLLTADQVFVNLGTHGAIPAVPGLKEAGPMTNIEALELDYVPAHLIVLGGGYVGLELAQAFRRFGSNVTVIEHGPQIAAREDPDVAEELRRILTGEGIEILTGATVRRAEGRSGKSVSLVVGTPSGERTIEGSDILVATGRIPNTASVGLDVAGIELDGRGYIKVNDRLETTGTQVWAIGECCSGDPQFTHVSYNDFQIIRDNLAGGNRTRKGRLVPYCMFTEPQLARVGLSEGEARQQGIAVRVAKLPVDAIMRTHTTGERQGFMKALVAAREDRIVGFTMIGPEAGEVMAAVQMAMLGGLPSTAIRDAVLAHPTMAEGLNRVFAAIPAAT